MEHGCRFSGTMISFGYGCYVNVGCFFDTAAAIVVADGVALGSGVRLITSHHEIGPRNRRAGPLSGRPIRIEEGAWLGTGVIVLAGVTIGAGSVVAAGAVVIADCEANTLYGGVPAKRIRSLNQD